jgi:hypothetical protein
MPIGFDLKGVTLGGRATPQQIEQQFAPQKNTANAALIPAMLRVKCGVGAHNWQVCNGMTSVADVMGQLNLVIDDQGIVQRMNVTFPAIGFAQVKDALSAKLGSTEAHKHVTDQNRFGATFDDEMLMWKDGNKNEVLLKQYAGDLDHSILSFTTQIDRDNSANVTKGHSSDL